jgi:phage shock protein C
MTCVRCGKEVGNDSAFCRFCGASQTSHGARQLTRIPDAGKIAGVCAGIANYFSTDVTVVRLLWVILSIVPGVIIGGVLAYAAAWLLMPATGIPAASERVPAKRLVRPVAQRKIGGVCAGVAQFLDVDATLVRLLWVILSIYPGALVCGIVFYLIAWLIIPSEPGPRWEPVGSAA